MPECKKPATPNGDEAATPNGDWTDIVKSGWDNGQLAICCSCTFPGMTTNENDPRERSPFGRGLPLRH